LQVPANRIGFSQYDVGQLKILQEAITLSVFVPFALFYMKQPMKLDFLWAALCILGAVYFVFRDEGPVRPDSVIQAAPTAQSAPSELPTR